MHFKAWYSTGCPPQKYYKKLLNLLKLVRMTLKFEHRLGFSRHNYYSIIHLHVVMV